MAKSDPEDSVEIDKYLNDSSEVVDREELNEKVRVLDKNKFEKHISKSIDKVLSKRDIDLSNQEREDVSEIIKRELKQSGVKNVESSLESFFDEVKQELSNINEIQNALKTFFGNIKKELATLKETREEQKSIKKAVADIQSEMEELKSNQTVQDTLQEFMGEIKEQLSSLQEEINEIPATPRDFQELQGEASDAGAIVEMMSDESVEGQIKGVDEEEESEDVSSSVERLQEIKEKNDE